MILAHWQDDWYIAEGAPGVQGCGLRLRRAASPPEGFQLYRYDTFWHKYFPDTTEITFYPELRYRGCKVTPSAWHQESAEPFLGCWMMPWDLNGRALFGHDLVGDPAVYTSMTADGWNWDIRDGGMKYIHVDDLEKIEGPPPEGAF